MKKGLETRPCMNKWAQSPVPLERKEGGSVNASIGVMNVACGIKVGCQHGALAGFRYHISQAF